MESLASDNPWNPGSRAFWGSEPENKVNLLFIVGILGLFLTAFSLVGLINYFWIGSSAQEGVPLFHGFVLLLAIKMKSRPSNVFRAVLGLVVIWSIIKMLFAILGVWGLYGYHTNTYILGISLLYVWMTGITFLLWKHVGDREFHGPNPNALMIFIFVTFILVAYQYITWLNYWSESGIYLLMVFKILGFPLFWGAFTLLYIYRTEIEPWEDASTSYDLESHQTRHGISAFNASKLKEAKELLDNKVISEEEFQQIKDEYLQ